MPAPGGVAPNPARYEKHVVVSTTPKDQEPVWRETLRESRRIHRSVEALGNARHELRAATTQEQRDRIAGNILGHSQRPERRAAAFQAWTELADPASLRQLRGYFEQQETRHGLGVLGAEQERDDARAANHRVDAREERRTDRVIESEQGRDQARHANDVQDRVSVEARRDDARHANHDVEVRDRAIAASPSHDAARAAEHRADERADVREDHGARDRAAAANHEADREVEARDVPVHRPPRRD